MRGGSDRGDFSGLTAADILAALGRRNGIRRSHER